MIFKSFLTRLFADPPDPADFVDPILGALEWSEETWVVPAPSFHGTVSIQVGGDTAPDARLLAHARDLCQAPEDLMRKLTVALETSAHEHHPSLATEIRALRLDSICLFWPDRPDDGMLYMAGGKEGRVWYFHYIDRHLGTLNYDC